jgi:hypothetical protein
MASRAQNERKFKHWEELPNGGRRYIREFAGRAGGIARTSKKSVQKNALCDLRRKFMIPPVADKITDYRHGTLSQTELVDWAERAMMDADFDKSDVDLLTDIVGQLGLADIAEFGLRWQDCEEFLRRLGYRAKVIVSSK